jgi:sortase (surface protein transpeptidase)
MSAFLLLGSGCSGNEAPLPNSYLKPTAAQTETAFLSPVRLEIPKLALTAPIEPKGLLDTGQMAVPNTRDTVAWFSLGTVPGQQGNSVMAGHVDDKKGPAVFFYLSRLTTGDFIHVEDIAGNRLTFVVLKKEAYDRENAPLAIIFGPTNAKRLNLITCTGSFNRENGTHEKRLVVYTALLETKPGKLKTRT